MESVYEILFNMQYHGKWSFLEAFTLPVMLRNWFAKRLSQEKEKEAEAAKPKKK